MSIEKLTEDEREFLREAHVCVVCHIKMISPNYHVAESLERKSLIKLVGDKTMTLRGVYLTKKGRSYAEKLEMQRK